MVGRAARMRLSSAMPPLRSKGTLKSTRTRTRCPATSMSRTDFFINAPPSRTGPRAPGALALWRRGRGAFAQRAAEGGEAGGRRGVGAGEDGAQGRAGLEEGSVPGDL